MAISTLKSVVDRAFAERYGVPAINVVNDLTMEAVLAGAVEARSPVIVQTSVKTVKTIGSRVLFATWEAMTAGIEVPVVLHLDHCPDRAVITECLRQGWNSVLFDASVLPVAENQRQTIEVVAEARGFGAHVEGEIESITGVEDGIGSEAPSARQSLEISLRFIEATGVDVFAPAIGNAHGVYKREPVLDFDRVTDLVAAHPIPIALHGGSGLSPAQFTDLIGRGCAKVNISTALKMTFMQSSLAFLKEAEARDTWDPPSLFGQVRGDVVALTRDLAVRFGSAGKA
ncbi:class II fructose-bisphosphate aldolase [Cryobacterium sinapicolor]|uniref:Class II fructose-bisphosphate aldolase n=1 Tax=Cryobacterium sinapicolor TaxID=1259236 RepID=A0ABY2JJX2_9MICO|nr:MULTISPECIES: class II fructose-bisphosphate aldolase [Cryobacterium]TFC93769.1 class II fructose-bisphosphate aldolase [Cryobacterium sp. TMT3-29-2]TFD05354.1 class II fructose-bisphosphate aldolase [Cryobacterium sinapicolor]